ncbi:MAG: radical SAM protein [Candidatus Omnitrophota bacterium]|jgi:radical SAM superfamily enzyme YgiQ (UPF0313 family)|nr:MAG: radical SAM protein [Candidatus Omnitrophota bacterium]
MKLLLVNPPYLEDVYSGFKHAVQVQIPLGLAYIAASAIQEGAEVEILDANAEQLSIEQTISKILLSDSDIIGLSSTTLMIPIIAKLAREVKRQSNKKIIIGGPHVTFFPEETLTGLPEVDIIVMGEGEETVKELIRNSFGNLFNIRGIAFRDKGKIIVNHSRERIEDLDTVMFPARELFRLELYRPGALWNIGFSGKKSMTLISSRGCPSRCRYCSSLHFWGPKVRFRSIGNIISEIEMLYNKYGTRQIAILDDTFLANKTRAEEFCDELLKRKLKINWWCYARLDFIYPRQLFRKMRRAGCYGLNFGVESGNQGVLDDVQKNIKLPVAEEIVASAKREGFLVLCSFMIGLPKDDKETVRQTIEFSIKLNPHIAQYCITTPFPGTDLYRQAKEKGWLDNVRDWADMGLHQRTKFHNDYLSGDDIYELYQSAHKRFYFRFGYFWMLFCHLLKNPRQIRGFLLAGIYMITEVFRKR